MFDVDDKEKKREKRAVSTKGKTSPKKRQEMNANGKRNKQVSTTNKQLLWFWFERHTAHGPLRASNNHFASQLIYANYMK